MTKSKYNITQKVYVMSNDFIVETTIKSLAINEKEEETYLLSGFIPHFTENNIFENVEELLQTLKENVKEPSEIPKKIKDSMNTFRNKLPFMRNN